MLEKGTKVFGDWTIDEHIGSGAFGAVYKIRREEFEDVYFAALKVINIPQDPQDQLRLRSEGLDNDSINTYYGQIAKNFIQEIKLLSSLDGNTNIVDYKDHSVVKNGDLGYTIYIRMQLLTPLNKKLVDSNGNAVFLNIKDILSLGVDMCSALELCEKHKIIHRDIKIDNIFVSSSGDYKLGDFGIAKQLEATQGEMSKKGTMMYMAPEVFRGENYNNTADIYSLGIVLYRLLNKNRSPFFPAYPETIRFSDKETANLKRLSGAELPAINGVSDELMGILNKACAFNPIERYQSASEFRRALKELIKSGDFLNVAVDEVQEFGGEEIADTDNQITTVDISEDTIKDFEATEYSTASLSDDEITEKTASVFGDATVTSSVSTEEFNSASVFEAETKKTESVFSVVGLLENTMSENEGTVNEPDLEKTESVFSDKVTTTTLPAENTEKSTPEKQNQRWLVAIVIVISALIVGAFLLRVFGNSRADEYSEELIVVDTDMPVDATITTATTATTQSPVFNTEQNTQEQVIIDSNENNDYQEDVIYLCNICGLSGNSATAILDEAGISCYYRYVYSSSYDKDVIVDGGYGWIDGYYACSGNEVELLISLGDYEDTWYYSNTPPDDSRVVTDVRDCYEVSVYDEDYHLIKETEYNSWDELYYDYLQYSDENVSKDDIVLADYTNVGYQGGYLAVFYYYEVYRWRYDFGYKIWD